MSAQRNETQQADGAGLRFGSGYCTVRSEDAPLLTGRGQFTDDLDISGQAHAAFVRATVAHAVIRKVDTASAMKMPGVIAAITGRDLAADNIGDIPPVASLNGRDGKPMFQAPMPVLVTERVRYVGEAIAVVVAETADQARDIAISAFILSPVIGGFFAAGAAWYRRFLALSSPNRARNQSASQKKQGDGRSRGTGTSQKANVKR